MASTSTTPNVDTLVLDAGPIIDRKPLRGLAKRYITSPGVMKELGDARSRQYIEQLALLQEVNVEVRAPTVVAMAQAIALSKKTGDYAVLSQVDLSVIALTWELDRAEKQDAKTGPVNLAGVLSVSGSESSGAAAVEAEGSAEAENEARLEPNDTTIEVEDADENIGGLKVEAGMAVSDDNLAEDLAEDLENIHLSLGHGDEVPQDDLGEDDAAPTSSPQNPPTPSIQVVAETHATSHPTGDLYDDFSSEDDGEGEWITPTNVSRHQAIAKGGATVTEDTTQDQPISVACMTGDFAVQNCLLHMGLQLVSYEGKRIREVKTSVLRCHGCFKICKDQTKKFCPTCGGPTLTRVFATIEAGAPGEEPKTTLHFKRTYQWKLKGANADLPPPRVGHASKGGEPAIILREDQKEWQRGVWKQIGQQRKEERRIQRVLSEKEKRGDEVWHDADWVPQLLVGGARGSGGLPAIGKNPYARRGRRK